MNTTTTNTATCLFPKPTSTFLLTTIFREPFPLSHVRWKTLEVHCDSNQSISQSAVSRGECSKPPELLFNRLQPSDEECRELKKRSFGQFVAREAVLDEEYWVVIDLFSAYILDIFCLLLEEIYISRFIVLFFQMQTAAWLRAEANWESFSYMRHVDSFKRKYAEQAFYALKRRCGGRDGISLKCFCFVAVKKEDKNLRRTVLNSVVGTLDLSIRQLFPGETYPGEVKTVSSTTLASLEPYDARRYGYVANVCVSKFARRQGIAFNMLHLATDVATSSGMKQLFVHVNADNRPAQELYTKAGFKVVEAASSPLPNDQRLLMHMKL